VTPGEMPRPPADLKSRSIILVEFGDSVFRTHSIHRKPIFYGKSRANRFDAPDGSYGVLYVGRDPFCAFIETFARAAGTRIVTTSELEKNALAEIKPNRTLRLIDLTQSGALTRIGADANLFGGGHGTAQQWSKALHDCQPDSDGLLYLSRLDPQRHALALFSDRAPSFRELSRQSWYAPGSQRRLLAELMDHYGLELIETRFVVPRKPAARARPYDLFEDQ